MKNISILGSTGSIGTQTLSVVSEHGDINVCALSCGSNIKLLEEQIRKYRPALAAVREEKDAETLRLATADLDIKIVSGMEGMIEVATYPESEIVVTAIVGMLGLRPTEAAIRAGKDIALANKETLVTAGHIIMPLAREYNVSILPVDSEHSAIFQCLQGNEGNSIEKILLTCSGGPFRGRSLDDLEKVTKEQALAHPNWNMGKKITIDSATMINKGLEVIEACHLFNVSAAQIEVVVHPESIIHSAVEFEDGAVMAQLGVPDMRLPIQYALYYPGRRLLSGEKLDLFKLGSLTFEKPDTETFFGLALAFDAIAAGGNVPTVFNAANEYAVQRFLKDEIGFTQIPEMISEAMAEVVFIEDPSIEEVLYTEQETYRYMENLSL